MLVTLKSSKDTAAFAAGSKTVAADHKAETTAINELGALLKPLSDSVSALIVDLQKQDR